VGHYRSISVLNSSVKIISKALASRLRNFLGENIGDHQTSFLKGRSTLNSISTAQEVIQFTKRNKVPGFMPKLDFEKS